jgi:hypothetical protein
MRHPVLAALLSFALVLTACSSATDGGENGGGGKSSDAVDPTPGSQPSVSPKPSKDERILAAVTNGPPSYVADPRQRYVPMWEKLGRKDPSYAFDTRNPNGGVSPMLIVDGAVDDHDELWFEVLLPIRPNGSSAWVRNEDVKVQRRHDSLEVDLSKRTLEHYSDGELMDRFKVGVGQPQYPTGTGQFYVWVKVPFEDPYQPYGIFALGLSGFSPVLSDWPGEGRMAIHGTPYASNRGQAVSHGCVRVYNTDMESLVDLPLGTPVLITK